MATITKRKNKNGTYSYKAEIRIKDIKAVTKAWPTRKEAERWAAQTETEIREGRYFNKAATKHTVAEAIDKFVASVSGPKQSKHNKDTCRYLKHWRKVIGHHFIDNIEPAIIEEEQAKLLETISPRTKCTLNPTTVRYYLIALSRVFAYISIKYIVSPWFKINILKSVKIIEATKGRERYLKSEEEDNDELKRLIEASKEVIEFRRRNKTLKKSPGSLYLYYILQLTLWTGLRSGEIKELKWEDIYLNKGELKLYNTKNGESYTVPLVSQAVDMLLEHFQTRRLDTPYVFPSKDGTGTVDWRRPFKEALDFANISNFTFHDLRHTFASYLTMAGESDVVIQAAMRHKSSQSTRRYKHVSSQYKNDKIQAMVNARLKNISAENTSICTAATLFNAQDHSNKSE